VLPTKTVEPDVDAEMLRLRTKVAEYDQALKTAEGAVKTLREQLHKAASNGRTACFVCALPEGERTKLFGDLVEALGEETRTRLLREVLVPALISRLQENVDR